jgi:hypothetical protein
MLRLLLDALIALVVEETARHKIPRLLRHAWLLIFCIVTWELGSEYGKDYALEVFHMAKSRNLVWPSYLAVAVLGAAVFTFYWWTIGKALTAVAASGHTKESFKFHEDSPSDYYTIYMGKQQNRIGLDVLQRRWNFAEIDGEHPLQVYREGNDVYVDARVYDQEGNLVLELEKSTIKNHLPSGWEVNYNDNAMEVVDANWQPVFQMIRDHPGTLRLNAKWYGKHGSFIGVKAPLTAIFRYPYWKYPNKYAVP